MLKGLENQRRIDNVAELGESKTKLLTEFSTQENLTRFSICS